MKYPTEESWAYFMQHHDDIRDVAADYLPQPSMELPNTRVADRVPEVTDPEMRDFMSLNVRYTLSDFDKAVADKNSNKICDIMNDVWLRLPENRAIYHVPGVSEMCNLLDCTVDGFYGPEEDDGC